jgi:hypothetical protein
MIEISLRFIILFLKNDFNFIHSQIIESSEPQKMNMLVSIDNLQNNEETKAFSMQK